MSEKECPIEGCDNPELDDISDEDEEFDWFCVWCGNLFIETEDGLNVQ